MVDILMPLVDPLNRYIDYLRISVTDRCNLNCVYCKPRERMKALPHREILQYEEILRLVTVAAPLGISRVRITGGEPLIRRGIIDLISSLNQCRDIEDITEALPTKQLSIARVLEDGIDEPRAQPLWSVRGVVASHPVDVGVRVQARAL